MPSSEKIRYRAGYRYQLAADYELLTKMKGQAACIPGFIELDNEGLLRIRAAYSWDGPSGPTYDSRDSLRASLVHDAIYQLMRAGKLPQEVRKYADELFYQICRQDGMWPPRAWLWLMAVRGFAASAAKRQREKILEAP